MNVCVRCGDDFFCVWVPSRLVLLFRCPSVFCLFCTPQGDLLSAYQGRINHNQRKSNAKAHVNEGRGEGEIIQRTIHAVYTRFDTCTGSQNTQFTTQTRIFFGFLGYFFFFTVFGMVTNKTQ
jgi:hypothetical protein